MKPTAHDNQVQKKWTKGITSIKTNQINESAENLQFAISVHFEFESQLKCEFFLQNWPIYNKIQIKKLHYYFSNSTYDLVINLMKWKWNIHDCVLIECCKSEMKMPLKPCGVLNDFNFEKLVSLYRQKYCDVFVETFKIGACSRTNRMVLKIENRYVCCVYFSLIFSEKE